MRNLITALTSLTLASCLGIPDEILKSKSVDFQFPIYPSAENTVVYLISPVAYQDPSSHQEIRINGSSSKLYYGTYRSVELTRESKIQYRFNHASSLVDHGKWNQLSIIPNDRELFYVLKRGLFSQVTKEQAITEIVTIEYRFCEYKPKPCEAKVYKGI